MSKAEIRSPTDEELLEELNKAVDDYYVCCKGLCNVFGVDSSPFWTQEKQNILDKIRAETYIQAYTSISCGVSSNEILNFVNLMDELLKKFITLKHELKDNGDSNLDKLHQYHEEGYDPEVIEEIAEIMKKDGEKEP